MSNIRHEEDMEVARRALGGEATAIESLLGRVQDGVYRLSIKFLWDPEDAADASQEIMIRLLTHLHTYRGESLFSTWAYRVAVNYLLNAKKTKLERRQVDFASIENELRTTRSEPDFVSDTEDRLLAEQVRAACTHAMLQALDRDGRMAFLLGQVFEMNSDEAAWILEISRDAYRQRLHRAREKMNAFLDGNCGVANPEAACRCVNRIDYCRRSGALNSYLRVAEELQISGDMDGLQKRHGQDFARLDRMVGVFRHDTDRMPPRILGRIRKLFQSDELEILRTRLAPDIN